MKPGADCGPRALGYLLGIAGMPTSHAALARECGTDADGTSLQALETAAQHAGVQAEALQVDAAFLEHSRRRGLAWVDGGRYVYFEPELDAVETARVWDPNGDLIHTETWVQLAQRSQGVVLLATWGRDHLPAL